MTTRSQRGQPATAEAPRVVLDTNLVLSALVFVRGTTAQWRSARQVRRCVLLVSTVTAQELVRVLAYPAFKLDPAEQEELLADYLPYAQVVTIPQPLPVVPHWRDGFDLPFLHLAAAGQAAALVTSDADLLSLGRVGRSVIVTPDAFLSGMPGPEPANE